METGSIKYGIGGFGMKYWQQIDLATIGILLDNLNQAANMLEDGRKPLDECLDYAISRIDHCIDELNYYYLKGLRAKEKQCKKIKKK